MNIVRREYSKSRFGLHVSAYYVNGFEVSRRTYEIALAQNDRIALRRAKLKLTRFFNEVLPAEISPAAKYFKVKEPRCAVCGMGILHGPKPAFNRQGLRTHKACATHDA